MTFSDIFGMGVGGWIWVGLGVCIHVSQGSISRVRVCIKEGQEEVNMDEYYYLFQPMFTCTLTSPARQ
jgi:hypothetical protein